MEAEFLRKYVARDQKSFTIIIYEVNLLRAYFFHTSTKAACLYPIDFYSAEIECRCILKKIDS